MCEFKTHIKLQFVNIIIITGLFNRPRKVKFLFYLLSIKEDNRDVHYHIFNEFKYLENIFKLKILTVI